MQTTLNGSDKRKVALFLDFDGVFLPTAFYDDDYKGDWNGTLRTLFPGRTDAQLSNLELRMASTHHFSQESVDCLHLLINKVQEVATVVIVISSDWRKKATVQELREKILHKYEFSKYIIDKTPTEHEFELKNRGMQIDFWLRENIDRLGITGIGILDDQDFGISQRFPNHFVRVQMLKPKDVDKAHQVMTKLMFTKNDFRSEREIADQDFYDMLYGN